MTLLSVWGKDNGQWMQALHFIFGIGTLVAPLVAEPFLADQEKVDNCLNGENVTTEAVVATVTEPSVGYPDVIVHSNETMAVTDAVLPTETCYATEETRVMYAYLITAAAVLCLVFALFFIFWTSGHQVRKSRQPKSDKKETREQRDERMFSYLIVFLVFVFYILHCMLEIVYGNYIMTFSVKYLKWTKTMGATLNSVYWGVYSVTRAFGILIIRFVKPQTMLFASCFIIIISLMPLLFLVTKHEAVFWVCSLGVGVGISLFFPTGISWAEQYVDVAGRFCSVFMVGGAGGELVGPPLVGVLFVQVGPMAFIYVAFTTACLILAMFSIMCLVASRHGLRYEESTLSVTSDQDLNRELQPMNMEANHVHPVGV